MKKRITYIGAVLYVLFVTVVVALYQGPGIFYIVNRYADISYQDNFSMLGWPELKTRVLIYGIIAFFVTHSLLRKTSNTSSPIWWLYFSCSIYDIVSYFGGVLFMVVYNNFRFDEGALVLITSTDNVFILMLLQVLKRILLQLYFKYKYAEIL